MKLLHTSDWHLGKTIHGRDLLEDQEHVVKEVEEELKKGYKALLIAGDIYDRAVPPGAAIELLSGFIERVSAMGVEIILIPGNHDNPQRLSFASGLLSRERVHIRCGYKECMAPIVLEEGGDKVQVFTLPFVEEAVVRGQFADENITDHASATEFLVSGMRGNMEKGVPSILVAHAYTGREAIRSDSERELLLGDQGRVPSELFSGFTYVALGHLHNPQTASRECCAHYSGSIMPYSFSEAGHSKTLCSLRIEGGKISKEDVPVRLKRNFSVLEDTLENLLHDNKYEDNRQDFVCARLTDRSPQIDIQTKLSGRYTHLLDIHFPFLDVERTQDGKSIKAALNSPSELFSLFLDKFGWDDKGSREVATELFEEARKALSRSEREE